MSHASRIAGVVIGVAVVCVLLALYIGIYLTAAPGAASAIQTPAGPHLYLATVPQAEPGDAHPTWVSYYAVSPTSTDWRHDTTYVLPANTVVTVTVYEYDTQTGLRNNFIGAVQGTVGGTIDLNGKPVSYIDPDTASHIFAIPQLGLNVPLEGPGSNAHNLCAQAPCSLSNAHETITFRFRTPGKGLYRWQCFVPCALGFINGVGGPMATVGYMDGYIKVV
ncbi:MAG TPA: hypothetical protein VKV27_01060 [Solirubrobacteraceae bacterium]|nr:hypothetical protein [Solirubrobacteraceae bacterium]